MFKLPAEKGVRLGLVLGRLHCPLLERRSNPGTVQSRLLRPRGDGMADNQRRSLGRDDA